MHRSKQPTWPGFALIAVLAAAACAPVITDGEAAITQNSPGELWQLVDAVFVADAPLSRAEILQTNISGSGTILVLSGDATVCKEVDHQAAPGTPQFFIRLGQIDSHGRITPATKAGTYPVVPLNFLGNYPVGKLAFVLEQNDPATTPCGSSPRYVQAGTITVSSVTGSKISGSFDIAEVFSYDNDPSSQHLQGTFDAAECTPLGEGC